MPAILTEPLGSLFAVPVWQSVQTGSAGLPATAKPPVRVSGGPVEYARARAAPPMSTAMTAALTMLGRTGAASPGGVERFEQLTGASRLPDPLPVAT